ncbi:MAG: hypothetical protein R3C19_22540 [Planctomycetaceae bacterium]
MNSSPRRQEGLISERDLRDTREFREQLADAFDTIHQEIHCEHVPGEPFIVADAILRLDVPGVVVEMRLFSRHGFSAKLSLVCSAVGRRLIIFDVPGTADTRGDGRYQFYCERRRA